MNERFNKFSAIILLEIAQIRQVINSDSFQVEFIKMLIKCFCSLFTPLNLNYYFTHVLTVIFVIYIKNY